MLLKFGLLGLAFAVLYVGWSEFKTASPPAAISPWCTEASKALADVRSEYLRIGLLEEARRQGCLAD